MVAGGVSIKGQQKGDGCGDGRVLYFERGTQYTGMYTYDKMMQNYSYIL